jgi:adenylate kinase family enzyme
MVYERIVIVGKCGAGKTTLAAQLASKLGLNNVELDAINWQPNWVNLPRPLMRERVDEALPATGRWVADGNYVRAVRDIVWTRADTLVWLDYPLWLALWRVLQRTIGRIFWRKELWNGNRETLGHHLTFNMDQNLFAWTIRIHNQHRNDFPPLFQQLEYSHLSVLRFRSPRETEEWLKSLPDAADRGSQTALLEI